LRVLVRHCYDNVPYYRSAMERAKLTPDDLRTADDLPKLPLLTSEDIRNNYETLIARGSSPSSLYAGFTSGTTGAPLKLFYDRSAVIAKNAIHWRQKSAAGLQLGDRMAQFWGRILIPAEQSKPPFWRYNW
ncbi:MAG: phenylacetate--CoA ligase family protein, partial [Acidobacteria bacterium]|nr:phenylacetate--CoA ligase family protein [Acidobacteriota bacterium]NIQ84144.1 phenylacetate--CoA ligase family protein [Acidobacteriota bacterium]